MEKPTHFEEYQKNQKRFSEKYDSETVTQCMIYELYLKLDKFHYEFSRKFIY